MRAISVLLHKYKVISKLNNFSTSAIVNNSVKKKVCIVGAGPAGFYAAQYLLKHLNGCDVDIIERLPVPFGLVRFGVAPDHPEVKNVINTFSKTAENPRVRFLGNLTLGKDFSLKELREYYHAVVLTYGAEKDRKLNIPNEDSENVLSARKFVAWYNGLPGAEGLNPDLSGESVSIIGQGNVAIDVARILLSPIDKLKNTDITQYALEGLCNSKVKKVYLVGRRGPLQAAFTIKELREMLKLENVSTLWREKDFEGIKEVVGNLQRPRKRLTELMLTSVTDQSKANLHEKQFLPIFFRSPQEIDKGKVNFTINRLDGDKAVPTKDSEEIPSDLALRSIGYKSICVDEDLNFDDRNGYICNKCGRVLKKGSNEERDVGLYVAGWLATGPTGVILTTMNGAFTVAKTLCEDVETNAIDCSVSKPGLDITKYRVVTWDGWKRIDKAEIEAGKKVGKPREKIVDVAEMLKLANL